jgi:hypothetical protein
MSAFIMQVACSCDKGQAVGMEQLQSWDGEYVGGGFIEGRRYIWRCPECNHQVCVNMQFLDEEE